MKVVLAVVGKISGGYLQKGIDDYCSRLKHYLPFEILYVPDARNTRSLSQDQQKAAEGRNILSLLDSGDYVVLLDERGRQYTSMEFAKYLERRLSGTGRRLVFVVGGPYGFSPEVYSRADEKLSLSSMTFSHEMIRLIFIEQLYRAETIINHQPYHHE